jgi:hypothetical protein
VGIRGGENVIGMGAITVPTSIGPLMRLHSTQNMPMPIKPLVLTANGSRNATMVTSSF